MNTLTEMPKTKFIPPTEQEIVDQCMAIGLPVSEGEKFLAYYEMVGWVVGRHKKPVSSWKGCMRTWQINWKEKHQFDSRPSPSVESIKNQRGLERVEDRLKTLRGQLPFTAGDKRIQELADLKIERTRLMSLLGFKA